MFACARGHEPPVIADGAVSNTEFACLEEF